MNRKIIFRAKRPENNDWVYGDLLHPSCVSAGYEIHPYIRDRHACAHEVDKDTIGQFTGLYDKNGREIYEGDIVLHKTYHGEKPCVVRFECGAFIVGYHKGSSIKRTPMLINKSCILIGNIHDNPELIKEDSNEWRIF